MDEDARGGFEDRMMRLWHGLEQVAQDYGRYVELTDSDPSAFGGGHYVFYRLDDARLDDARLDDAERRFAIEEQYADEVSEEEQIPTSWTWRDESLRTHPDGGGYWHEHDSGEVASEDFEQLLDRAGQWAQQARTAARRDDAASAFAPRSPAPIPRGPDRSL